MRKYMHSELWSSSPYTNDPTSLSKLVSRVVTSLQAILGPAILGYRIHKVNGTMEQYLEFLIHIKMFTVDAKIAQTIMQLGDK
jgi:hypothetical protein